jgi:hypothetical protein
MHTPTIKRLSLPTPRPLHHRPIMKYIKRGKYKIFRAQSYTKIRSPINKITTIAGKNINSDSTQQMIRALRESNNGNK